MEKLNLKDFINTYIELNSLIKLQYKVGNNYKQVLPDEGVMMEHELSKSHYKDCIVIGVKDILYLDSHYKEAINIVIEKC